jgi:hypothetical protein
MNNEVCEFAIENGQCTRSRCYFHSPNDNNKEEIAKTIKRHLKGLTQAVEKLEKEINNV